MVNTKVIYNEYVDKGGKLSYVAFKEFIFEYIKQALQECLSTGGKWKLPYFLGNLYVGKIKRKFSVKESGTIRGSVDWGASNKLKQEIIQSGRIPLTTVKNDKNEIIETNNGVPWLCYFTDDHYYKWMYDPGLYLTNIYKYKFKISWTNSKNLTKAIDDKSEYLYTSVQDRKR